MRVTATPAFGSKNVAPSTPVTVTLFSAKFDSMTVTGDDASTLTGKVSADGRTWTLGQVMKYGVTYTFSGDAKATNGSTRSVTGTLTTIKPAATVRASIQIPNGDTVGIAAPIIITFATAITDKAAAEKALKITTDKGDIQGSWGWLQDEDIQGSGVKQSIVHFRPAQYWPAYTKVHVAADLYGVNYGNGWGREDISSRLHRRPRADRQGRREQPPAGRHRRRQDRQELPGVVRHRVRPGAADHQRHPCRHREGSA